MNADVVTIRPPEAVGYIKRLVRNATETPLAQGLALARMPSYEGMTIAAPSLSIEAATARSSHD